MSPARLTRPGFNIKIRSRHKASVGKSHKITPVEAKEYLVKRIWSCCFLMAKDRSYGDRGTGLHRKD